MMRQSLDTLRCMKASGVTGVARYLDPFNPKGITPEEVADIHAAGLELHLVYETTGGTGRPDLYFTRAQGAADCTAADDILHGLGAPDGIVVYFAADVNVEPSSVTEYFNGVESAATPQITPGVYGYQRMCEYAKANYPGIGRHLWQTYGMPTVPLDLWQHLQEARCGVAVDVNDCTVAGWKGGDMTKDEVIALLAEYGIDKYKVPAIVKEFEQHKHVTPPELTSGPIVPPFDGAQWFGASADLLTIGWNDPATGKTRWFKGGAEVPA